MKDNYIKDNSFDEIKTKKHEAVETERYEEEKHRSWIQFWIPVIISLLALFRPEIIALIKSIINLYSTKGTN